MKRILPIALIAIVAFVIIEGLGFLFLKGPAPDISIKAETIFEIGPIPVKNTTITSWCVIIVIALIFWAATKKMALVPKGLQNLAEAIVEMINGLVIGTAGERHGRRFFPIIATIFIYVALSNWMALLPIFNTFGKVETLGAHDPHFREKAVVLTEAAGMSFIMPGAKEIEIVVDEAPCGQFAAGSHEEEECIVEQRETAIEEAREEAGVKPEAKLGVIAPFLRSVNTDLMSTLALALISVAMVEYWGVTSLGFFKYGSRFFNVRNLLRGKILFGVIDFAVGLLELVAEFARLISFSFRLFGNMLAGEIVLLFMTFLIPLLLAVPFYALELLVGVIQALIFGMLTLVFASTAVASHGDGEHSDEGH